MISFYNNGIIKTAPEGWTLGRNKMMFDIVNRKVGLNSSEYDLLSLTLDGIKLRDIDSGKGKFPAEFETYQEVHPNDLVFCLFDIDETPRTVGLSNHKGMITGAYTVVRCKKDIDPRYVYYYYLSVDYAKKLKPFYTGLRKVVRPNTFLNIPAPVPAYNEQKAIADFLDRETSRIDQLIKKKEAFIVLLIEKRKNTISSAILGLHKSFDSYKRSEIKIKYVADIISKKSSYEETAAPYIGLEHIKSWTGQITVGSDEKPEGLVSEFKAGDILFGKLRPNLAKVALPDFDGVCSTEALVLRPKKIINSYLRYALSEQTFIESVVGSTYGAKMPRASWEFIGSQKLRLPDASVQEKIAKHLDEKVSAFDNISSVTNNSIYKLEQMKAALVTESITGQLDIHAWQKRGLADRRLDQIEKDMEQENQKSKKVSV